MMRGIADFEPCRIRIEKNPTRLVLENTKKFPLAAEFLGVAVKRSGETAFELAGAGNHVAGRLTAHDHRGRAKDLLV